MQVKTYRAPTINRALELVKSELGEDALILGNKKVSVSPTENYVEVMAAIDPGNPDPLPSQPAPGLDVQAQQDLQEIKSFLSLLISSKDYFSRLQMQEPLAEVYHSLLIRGLDEKHCYVLLKNALTQAEDTALAKRQVVESFCRELLARIKFARPFHNLTPTASDPCTFSFLGPTGVGKTTSLAKLAAYLKIKRSLEVGIISIDNYRIGAASQLSTYSEILDIPFQVVQSTVEFQHARQQFKHHDVVLVDTSGRNYLRRSHVHELKELFGKNKNLHHFLVLSATAKDNDLKQTILHFDPIPLHSLIFTKVDETLTIGSVINQLLRFSCPVSYLGTGQQVPEDMELASPRRLLSFLFPSKNGDSGKN